MTLVARGAARSRRTWGLVRVLALREFRTRYRQSVLEVAWSLITPAVLLGVYGVVLTQVFDVTSPDVPYLSLVWTGMVVWMMFSSAVANGVRSILSNADLISKVYFPREALPLSVVGAAFFDLAIGTAVLVPLVAIQVQTVSITAVAAVPVVLVLVAWTAAVTTFLATLAVFLRDVAHATVLLLQVGFFITPVMYAAGNLPDGFLFLNRLNPLAVCINALRDAILTQQWPNWPLLGLHAVGGVVAFVLAILYVRRVEDRMVDVV